MLFLKYLFTMSGVALLCGAAVLIVFDLYQIVKQRRTSREGPALGESAGSPEGEGRPLFIHWHGAGKLAGLGLLPLLMGLSLTIVPSGTAGVLVSQVSGAKAWTVYPGVHWLIPLVERVELFDARDRVFTTTLADDPKKGQALRVQTKEGLMVGLAVTVRYRLDAAKVPYIYANLPQPVEQEIVPPVIASVFREVSSNYVVRDMFGGKREEVRLTAAGRIVQRLGVDGIVVKEVMLRDVQLPVEYARGLEGLLLKMQESERLNVELDVKAKEVRAAELEAEAQKAREVKQAEARAQVTVLEAKAQADAMQHTLPLKEKQIQQSRLEAEARKEATVKNAEAMAQAKVIDSRAELEKRKLMSEGEDFHIRRVAQADAERLKLEAEVLKQNPLLIQKIIAERLSDKVQIMMVPNDGKFFFANDVLKGMSPAVSH